MGKHGVDNVAVMRSEEEGMMTAGCGGIQCEPYISFVLLLVNMILRFSFSE